MTRTTQEKILYFAYGANMHPGQIKARCLGAGFVTVARLPGHKLAFFGASTVWDGALETVVPAPGREVWGVVYSAFAPGRRQPRRLAGRAL